MNDTPPGGIFAGGVDQHHTGTLPPTIEQVDSQKINQDPPQQVTISNTVSTELYGNNPFSSHEPLLNLHFFPTGRSSCRTGSTVSKHVCDEDGDCKSEGTMNLSDIYVYMLDQPSLRYSSFQL